MYYGITTEATDFTEAMMRDWRVRLVKALLFFIPRANPDNEAFYPQVKAWALELDEEGWPLREVGLDSMGNPLFGSPDARNTGFWPDMAIQQFRKDELQPISEAEFNALWDSVSSAKKKR